jgi:hypothetical protein
MNKKFAFTAVRKGQRKMDLKKEFKFLDATIASVNFYLATE